MAGDGPWLTRPTCTVLPESAREAAGQTPPAAPCTFKGMADLPYSALLTRRIPVTARHLLPHTAGTYAWWLPSDISEPATNPDGSLDRPLYVGAAANIAAAVTADALGLRDNPLRLGLANLMSEDIGLRSRTDAPRRPLNLGERQRLDHWISTNLLVSWSELPHPAYHDALVRALDPQLTP